MSPLQYTSHEMMVVAASRALAGRAVCFVGIGLPSAAANLARLTHAPGVVLIYESGTIETTPDVLPLSIGDSELCEQAVTTVSVPEMFRYWVQGGRVDVGFLGAAQIDPYANINTTVIGDYDHPKVRLPGGGGAAEMATASGEIFITLKHTPRAFVEKVDFVTSLGHGTGRGYRERLGAAGRGPTRVISDLCIMEPDAATAELTVTSLHPGVNREQVRQQTGWPIRFADQVTQTDAPEAEELEVLRELQARTERRHASNER